MLLSALGAVNFNHPRAGRRRLFEWVVTRIGRGAKKGMATVSRGLESRVPGEGGGRGWTVLERRDIYRKGGEVGHGSDEREVGTD